jgi:hypothetical protein
VLGFCLRQFENPTPNDWRNAYRRGSKRFEVPGKITYRSAARPFSAGLSAPSRRPAHSIFKPKQVARKAKRLGACAQPVFVTPGAERIFVSVQRDQ